VFGFLTAGNLFNDNDADLLKDIDGQSALAWVDNYCREHPLNALGSAPANLLRELKERAKHQ